MPPAKKSSRNPPRDRAADDLGRRLREEIRADGRTAYAIADASGLNRSVVSRIVSGERTDPKLSTVSALFAALGLRVVAGRRSPAPARRSTRPTPPPAPAEAPSNLDGLSP